MIFLIYVIYMRGEWLGKWEIIIIKKIKKITVQTKKNKYLCKRT
jgi:hypothetical protein